MLDVDPEVITHKLKMNPLANQSSKRRGTSILRNRELPREVDKLLEAGFVRKILYPEWPANKVLVQNANKKWRMCVDFTDLNAMCPKDNPLSRIDQLVEKAYCHMLLSFINAFSGYNQVQMDPEDEEKTAFIIDKSTFCYKMMPLV